MQFLFIVWDEVDHCLDVLRITSGIHIEIK